MKLFHVLSIVFYCFSTTNAMQQNLANNGSSKHAVLAMKAASKKIESNSNKAAETHPQVSTITANIVAVANEIQIINVATGEPISIFKELDITSSPILRFHPLGAHLAIGDKTGKFILCDVFSHEIAFSQNFNLPIIDFAFNKYGNYLAIAFSDSVKIMDIRTKMVIDERFSESKAIKSVRFSLENDCLVINDGDATDIWQPRSRL